MQEGVEICFGFCCLCFLVLVPCFCYFLGTGGSDVGLRAGGAGVETGDEAIGATQTSNSEHQFIFYGIRFPNSMPLRIKLDKKDPARVLVTRCRLPGSGPGPHQAGPAHFYINTFISLRGIELRPFFLYLATAELSPPVCDIPTGGGEPQGQGPTVDAKKLEHRQPDIQHSMSERVHIPIFAYCSKVGTF